MAAPGTMSTNHHKVPWGPALVSASLEWLLIFMLVVDAIFSYVITKFAHYWGLQTPCLLCSRLDHVLGNEKPGYYWDLICGSHKSEISSLVLCRAHNKLVDVNGMCESCLFSYATINRSNAETYRLLVGKLGEAPNSKADHEIEDPVLGGQYFCFSGRAHCSCCNEPQISEGYSHKLIHSKLFGSEAELEPLSGAIRQNPEELRKAQDKSSKSLRASHLRDTGLPLSHVGYTELKGSDTESEVHFSDGEDASASIHEKGKGVEPRTITPVLIDPPSVSKTLVSASEMTLDNRESHGNTSARVRDIRLHALSHVGYTELKVTSDTESEVHFSDDDYAGSLTHEMDGPKEDSSAQAVEPHVIPQVLTDPPSVSKPSLLVSQAQIDRIESLGSTSVASAVTIGHGLEELNLKEARRTPDYHALSEPLLENASPSSKAMEAPVEVSKRSLDVTGTREIDQAYVAESGEFHKRAVRPLKTSEVRLETNAVSSNTDQQVVNVLDLGDAYKIVVGSQGRQLPGVLAEQWIGKDSSRVTEDLKILLSQLSANRGIEQSTNEIISPTNSGDLKTMGMQIRQQRISLERNESGLSIDGSTVSEIEGESMLDRLKRQVEHDKKLLSSLYKELEEERNASAISSDQAMAMITRLQEEKAALHMEALQSLRMMEEQAEYDNEALHKIDDLLAEKEKEVQDLEAELEFYRIKYPNESMLECLGETTSDMQARDILVDHSVPSSLAESHKNTDARKPCTDSEDGGVGMILSDEKTGSLKNSLKDFEVEKKQILQCLEKLEKTLSLFSSNGVKTDSSKGNCSENGGDGAGKSNLQNSEQHSQENIKKEENDFSKQHEVPALSGHSSPHEIPQPCQANDLASLSVLASNLNKRLKALEAVLEFLEQAITSLKYGEEALKFIQEIASHLAELRKIGIRKDQTSA
ncbi:putative Zein-binding domain-containing protein [Rosa chinensis]|uniref:Putative Zein-binding domain-containing protein n=1 Tax=Rosa chinensis TaxID=74649 RepID=A0A2P6R5R4_ROSCH|nr:myosin-binding protein 1 isoform X1 [Rosa chinensis]PRQ41771.1 putative Zein-binding domain-containing protein [Rosa chinensis]